VIKTEGHDWWQNFAKPLDLALFAFISLFVAAKVQLYGSKIRT